MKEMLNLFLTLKEVIMMRNIDFIRKLKPKNYLNYLIINTRMLAKCAVMKKSVMLVIMPTVNRVIVSKVVQFG